MMNSLLGGRYLLGQMIGTGGMADVYIAQDQRLSREVAIKILRSDLAKDPAFVSRFRKEAKAAAGLNHPAIVAVYDSGEEPAPYIVMELVSGHTLRELIHQGERLPLNRALEIAEGILAGLEYSHDRHIVHRDIKPANVMITDSGDVKVMDFGIARAMDRQILAAIFTQLAACSLNYSLGSHHLPVKLQYQSPTNTHQVLRPLYEL
jgi:serine/threonine-protein kinase